MGTLWYGGTIYSMEKENEIHEAVYTNQGRIIATGTYNELIENFSEKIKSFENLNGKTMYPGFVDSHLHIVGHGEKLKHLDLSQMKSAEEVLYSLCQRAKELGEGEWLIGEGWNENQWDNPRIIHHTELDQVSTVHPIMLTRICRHAVLANSTAMKLAGISVNTPDPQGGKVVRDTQEQPVGYFLDTAQELIKQALPDISQQKLAELINMSIDHLLSLGLVGGHSEDLAYYGHDSFKKTLTAYKMVLATKKKFRAHLLVHHEVLDDMIAANLTYGQGGTFVHLGAMKIFSDGALGGRTAWLNDVYSDDKTNKGIPIHSQKYLEHLIRRARNLGLPIAVHAIGDKAIQTIVKLIQKYPLNNGRRDRIIHAQIVNEHIIKELKKTNVALDIQPSFVTSDFPWVIDRIKEKRAEQSYAWKTFLEAGIPCAAGSDAPIEDVNPLVGIKAAVLRKSSIDGEIYNKKQQLSVYNAISLYTKGSAYIINKETERGMIAPGYVADFTILDQDLFKINKEEIDQVNVVKTVVDGDIMYEKK
ncbi:amidohydrolase [Paraliobacillus sp. PM-2]|uniref:amidohydrolase n=1 Tax=Paraliobacillus sp. PM-2 TaxID=1462524 RepID=UPI000B8227DD|nr:amidohydrolase [Paraliobacillus sp. PM-2]